MHLLHAGPGQENLFPRSRFSRLPGQVPGSPRKTEGTAKTVEDRFGRPHGARFFERGLQRVIDLGNVSVWCPSAGGKSCLSP